MSAVPGVSADWLAVRGRADDAARSEAAAARSRSPRWADTVERIEQVLRAS